MEDGSVGAVEDFVAEVLATPAEVDFLHVGEEVGVEAAELVPDAGTHEHGGAGGPEDFAGVVVLAFVLLEGGEEASATEGVAVTVDEAACGTGILEGVLAVEHQELGLGDGNLGVAIHEGLDGGDPARGDLDVVVEEDVVVGVDLGEGAIVAFGEAVVAVEEDEWEGGVVATEEGDAVVGGAVVGDEDLGMGRAAGGDGGEEALEHVAAVPVEYDDGGFQD